MIFTRGVIFFGLLAIWGLMKGDYAVFFMGSIVAGCILVINILLELDWKLGSRSNVIPKSKCDDSKDDESPFIKTGRMLNDVVDDPLEGPLLINHDDNTLEDEYGNKRYDLEEINEAYVKDSKGHIYTRSKYK